MNNKPKSLNLLIKNTDNKKKFLMMKAAEMAAFFVTKIYWRPRVSR